MVFWNHVKNKIKDALIKIRNNPIADAAVKSVLSNIPILGSFLSSIYENSVGTLDEKGELIEKLIENLQNFPDDKLEDLKNAIEVNEKFLIKNDKALTFLVSATDSIIDKLNKIQQFQIELKEGEIEIQEILVKLVEMGSTNTAELNQKLTEVEKNLIDEFKKIRNFNEKFDKNIIAERLLFFLRLYQHLEMCKKTFMMQVITQEKLRMSLKKKGIELPGGKGFDEFFYENKDKMNDEELSWFTFLRKTTEDTKEYNSYAKSLLENNKEFFEEMPMLWDLFEHLSWWEAKYELLKDDPRMCLIYVGPTQGKRFPKIDNEIKMQIDDLRKQTLLDEPLISIGKENSRPFDNEIEQSKENEFFDY